MLVDIDVVVGNHQAIKEYSGHGQIIADSLGEMLVLLNTTTDSAQSPPVSEQHLSASGLFPDRIEIVKINSPAASVPGTQLNRLVAG